MSLNNNPKFSGIFPSQTGFITSFIFVPDDDILNFILSNVSSYAFFIFLNRNIYGYTFSSSNNNENEKTEEIIKNSLELYN